MIEDSRPWCAFERWQYRTGRKTVPAPTYRPLRNSILDDSTDERYVGTVVLFAGHFNATFLTASVADPDIIAKALDEAEHRAALPHDPRLGSWSAERAVANLREARDRLAFLD